MTSDRDPSPGPTDVGTPRDAPRWRADRGPDPSVPVAVIEQDPVPVGVAAREVAGCVVNTARLLARGRVRRRPEHVGMRLRFADGTSAVVYRETVIESAPVRDPCMLLVAFRLRLVRGAGHVLFRAESLLNTPLFAGFPGLVSKLWVAHDQGGVYRGLYEWDGPERAEHYARSLWWLLRPVCVPGSIHYVVLPGLRRDRLLADPHLLDRVVPRPAGGLVLTALGDPR